MAQTDGAGRGAERGAERKVHFGPKDYHQVKMDASVRLSPACSIVGDVTLGADVSVFAGAHIRGDEAPIVIGARSNVQENCSLHVSADIPLTVGRGVTVGHGAILHGCTIGDDCLIGMGSIVMDGAEIGEKSLVGAGALVTQGKKFPPRSMIFGSPARVVRELSDDEIALHICDPAEAYVATTDCMLAEGIMVHPDSDADIFPACKKAPGQNLHLTDLRQA